MTPVEIVAALILGVFLGRADVKQRGPEQIVDDRQVVRIERGGSNHTAGWIID